MKHLLHDVQEKLSMKFVKHLALAALTAALLAACGGGGNGDQSNRVSYSAVVNFGDSLSDPGAYKVGPIAQVGGLFTVNGIGGAIGSDPTPSYVWPQLVAASIVGTPSCAARVGYGTVPVAVPGCTNYAQGGSRVTDPNGPGRSGGALTEPVAAQIQNFLALPANGGAFKGTELVTVMAGANDMFAQSDILTAAATKVGNDTGNAAFATSIITQLVTAAPAANRAAAQATIGAAVMGAAQAANATPTSIITAAIVAAATDAGMNGYTNPAATLANAPTLGATAQAAATTQGNTAAATYVGTTGITIATAGMSAAAKELADNVKLILSKGAKKVVVLNIPDASQTPYGVSSGQAPLVLAMTQAFNARLKAELTGVAGVLQLDAFAENQKQFANPAQFGLTNVKDMVCKAGPTNPTGTSLLCNPSNILAGDTSRYMFADSVHPTPYSHKLLAQFVTKELVLAGWL
jgi:phospholipase/lecithinase/hemolysin